MRQIIFILSILLVSVSFSECGKKNKSEKIDTITPKSEPKFVREGVLTFFDDSDTLKTIDIEIADNNRDRMQGMMYRSSMDYNKGMLFIFEFEEEQSFWMKNTKLSLDIMYVNADLEIVSVYKHTPPYSETPIPSLKPAMYVIETTAGFCDEFNIDVGHTVRFQRNQTPA